MWKRQLALVFLAGAASTVTPTLLHAQSCDGSTVGEQFLGARTWTLVSNEDPTPTVRGVVESLKFNTGPSAGGVIDWDTNLIVRPVPQDEHYARNCKGHLNEPLDGGQPFGRIEYEVQTIHDYLSDRPDHHFRDFLGRLFGVGTPVEAQGNWVQDSGHTPDNPKTELHPLLWLTTQRAYRTEGMAVFVAGDISGRFTAGNQNTWSFPFSLPVSRTPLLVLRDQSHTASTALTNTVHERSMMDIETNGTRSSLARIFEGSTTSQEFTLRIRLREPVPPTLTDDHYIPFYLGRIDLTSRTELVDTVTKQLTNCGALGQTQCPATYPVMAVRISTSLPSTQWDWTEWHLARAGNGDPEPGEEQYENVAGRGTRNATFTRYYSPGAGFLDYQWLMTAASTTGPSLQAFPLKAGPGPGDADYLFVQRVYGIEPSEVRITVPPVAPQPQPRTLNPFLPTIMCSPDQVVLTAETHLLQGVNAVPGTFEWAVSPRVRADGTPVDRAGTSWTTLSTGNPAYSWEGVQIVIDAATPRQMTVTSSSVITGTQLVIRVREQTDLGERLEDDFALGWGCGSAGDPNKFFENIIKGLLAIEKLKARGVLPGPIPDDFARLLGPNPRISWGPSQHPTLGEPEEVLPRLSGGPKLAMEAIYKMQRGRFVTSAELTAVARFVSEASHIQWASPLPAAVQRQLQLPLVRVIRPRRLLRVKP